MNDHLYDVLEDCLQEMENGADVDTILRRYPEYADELRPILETSVEAKSLAVSDPSTEVIRRNRAKVLQQAAQMREAQVRPTRRVWSVPLRRALVSLAVIAVLFIGTNGLVHAASTTLPGDNLYPVKRTWEDVRVLLTLNTQARIALEVDHENKRLDELNDLFAERRSASVDFAGTVTDQNGDLWLVSKIPVLISTQTDLGTQTVKVGDAIRVRGSTQADGSVLAERVELLPAGAPLPDIEDDHTQEIESENSGQPSSNQSGGSEDHSSETQTPQKSETQSPGNNTSETSSLAGTVNSISGSIVVVNGEPMNISGAEVKGTLKVGASAKVEGYYDANGTFIVSKIEFQSAGSESGGSSSDNNSGSTDNHNDSSGSGSSNNSGSDDSGGGSTDSGGGGGD